MGLSKLTAFLVAAAVLLWPAPPEANAQPMPQIDLDLTMTVLPAEPHTTGGFVGKIGVRLTNNGPEQTGTTFSPPVAPFLAIETPLVLFEPPFPVEYFVDADDTCLGDYIFFDGTNGLLFAFRVVFLQQLGDGEFVECTLSYFLPGADSYTEEEWFASSPGDEDTDLSNNISNTVFGIVRPIPALNDWGLIIGVILMMFIAKSRPAWRGL